MDTDSWDVTSISSNQLKPSEFTAKLKVFNFPYGDSSKVLRFHNRDVNYITYNAIVLEDITQSGDDKYPDINIKKGYLIEIIFPEPSIKKAWCSKTRSIKFNGNGKDIAMTIKRETLKMYSIMNEGE